VVRDRDEVVAVAKTLPFRHLERHFFFALLGKCITAWADVERQLFYLFGQALFGEVVNQSDWGKAKLLFWTFPNFKMRLDYTSMLITHCLKPETGDDIQTEAAKKSKKKTEKKNEAQKYWIELNGEIKGLSIIRNRLAHHRVAPAEIGPVFDKDDTTVLKWLEDTIIPNEFGVKKQFKPIKEADLKSHLKSISEVSKKLKYVSVNLQHWKEMAQTACPT
jgi:hypothetical protein